MTVALILLVQPSGAADSDQAGEAVDSRREFSRWYSKVELKRRYAEAAILNCITALDEKARTRRIQPDDVLVAYRSQLLPRYRATLTVTTNYRTGAPDVQALNDSLRDYCASVVTALEACVAHLDQGDKKGFHQQQLKYLKVDLGPYRMQSQALLRKYAREPGDGQAVEP